ncbi:MAG: hypothetical protein VB021_08475 [Oscillospiraceae bacterium]|nr:hypothetical protein [Oscillospiraceae bacterium]
MRGFARSIVALLIVLALAACGAKGAPAAGEPAGETDNTAAAGAQDGGQEKQAGEVVIEVTPPEGWVKNEASVLPVQYQKGTATFMVKEEAFSGETLDDVMSEALSMFEDTFQNFAVEAEPEALTIDGKDARGVTFTCTVSGLEMKYRYVYLFAADRTYLIAFGDFAGTFDELAGDYEAILGNIRFAAQ